MGMSKVLTPTSSVFLLDFSTHKTEVASGKITEDESFDNNLEESR
jgi:hypothetical protein